MLRASWGKAISDDSVDVTKLKVGELRDELTKRGLSSTGKKDELVLRLKVAIEKEKEEHKEAERTSIRNLSHEDLITRLTEAGEPTTGDQDELVARLLAQLDPKRLLSYGAPSDYAVHSAGITTGLTGSDGIPTVS